MPEISSTDASRNFADMLDAVEHEGAHYTIVRRGKPVAHLEPVARGRGADVKQLLRRHLVDAGWSRDLASIRELVEVEERS